MKVKQEEPLPEGPYEALLRRIERKTTTFGERSFSLFEVPEHDAEIAGFTSLSESTMANAYVRAVALNAEIRSKKSWGSDDVVGKKCLLDVAVVEYQKGRSKNKIVRVRPVS
jgi:hypothetical protein